MSWTDERIATLKKMWKEGKSAAEIAKTLGKGVTRNAVIGKAHRMGLSGRPSPIKKQTAAKAPKAKAAASKKEAAPKKSTEKKSAAPAPAPKAGKAPTPAKASSKKSAAKEAPVEVPHFEKEEVPLGGGVPLIDLTERMCKWPIGDPREDDFTFCGLSPVRPGTPYCPGHAAMAYQSSSRSRAAEKPAEEKEVDDSTDEDEVGNVA